MQQGGFVYILESECGRYRYLGSTSHPDIRLEEHNRGVTKATKHKGPWKMLKVWPCDTLQKARQLEYEIKRKKKALTIEYIEYLYKRDP